LEKLIDLLKKRFKERKKSVIVGLVIFYIFSGGVSALIIGGVDSALKNLNSFLLVSFIVWVSMFLFLFIFLLIDDKSLKAFADFVSRWG